jgi:hypothetical protein
VKHAFDEHHALRVEDETIPVIVVLEPERGPAVARPGPRDDLALAGLSELAPPGALRRLGSLELGQLVQDAVRELPLWGVVSPIVQGAHLRVVLLELAAEQVVVGGLPGEPVAVLRQHHGDTTAGHEVPDRSIPGRSRLAPLWPGSRTSSRIS